MSSPLLWVILPGMAAFALFLVRGKPIAIHLAGVLIASSLALMAWLVPIEEPISILPWPRFQAFKISESFIFLGYQFVLKNSLRPLLVLIYSGLAFWLGGAFAIKINRVFVPLCLGITAMLTAAVAIEPFLFSAVVIEIVALACIPLLSPPGKKIGSGVIRFLTFQTIGMAALLFGGSLFSYYEINPGDMDLIWRAMVVLGVGFAFIMGVFPFHTWIPMVTKKAHPYSAAFVFLFLPATVSILGIRYLEQYAILDLTPNLVLIFQTLGFMMCLVGGFWAAFQRHLGRILGFGAVFEIGMLILALSLVPQHEGINPQKGIIIAQFIPRAVGFGVWSLSLGILAAINGNLSLRSMRGVGYKTPIACVGVLLGNLSIAGFPLLAGFPVSLALWLAISQTNPIITYLSLLGNLGLFIAAIRTFLVLFGRSGDIRWQVFESRTQIGFLVLGFIFIIMLGVFPQLYMPVLTNITPTLSISGP